MSFLKKNRIQSIHSFAKRQLLPWKKKQKFSATIKTAQSNPSTDTQSENLQSLVTLIRLNKI
jgi:hypothetical protein